MPNTTLTRNTIQEHVTSLLGGDNVEVEQADTMFNVALRKVVAVYNRYRPQYGKSGLEVVCGQREYAITEPG